MNKNDIKTPIFQSFLNSYRFLRRDAEFLLARAKDPQIIKSFQCTQLCRTAILLFILSLEGLINRAMARFLPEDIRDFILEREDKFALMDKWELLPLLYSKSGKKMDKSKSPWNYLKELIQIRNDMVHPKHDRVVFYKSIDRNSLDRLLPIDIPGNLTYRDVTGKAIEVKEKHLIYRQLRISKDPYYYRPEDAEKVKKAVDAIIDEFDKLLDGIIRKDGWLDNDQLTLIYPPGADISELR